MSRWVLRWILLSLRLCMTIGLIAVFGKTIAQPTSLESFDQKISHFQEKGLTDSLKAAYLAKAAWCRKTDDLENWLYCYWDLQASNFEDSGEALKWLETAEKQSWRPPKTGGEWEAWLWIRVNQGYHLFQLGKVLASTQTYEQAYQIYRKHAPEDFPANDYLFLPLGAHYTRLGDNARALALYGRAIRVAREAGDADALGGLYNNAGLTFWNEGENEQAIKQFREGLAVKGLSPPKASLLRVSLGRSLMETGKLDSAALLAHEALAALKPLLKQSDPAIQDYCSGAFQLSGNINLQRGRYAQAQSDLARALKLRTAALGSSRHREVAKIRVDQGQALLAVRDYEQAARVFNGALMDLLPQYVPKELEDLPREDQLYEENTLFEALEGKADALTGIYALDRRLSVLKAAFHCHQLAEKVEMQLRNTYLYESSKLLLQARRRERLEKAMEIGFEWFAQTKDARILSQAWAMAEGAKAGLLLDAVRENAMRKAFLSGDTLLVVESRLKKQLAYLEKQLLLTQNAEAANTWREQQASTLQQLERIRRQLRRKYPAFGHAGQAGIDPLEWLSGGNLSSAVIEFLVGGKAIYAFYWAPGQDPQWVRIPWNDSLQQAANEWIKQLGDRTKMLPVQDYQRVAFEWYDRLFGQIKGIKGNQASPAVIVPDAWLNFLPFEALVTAPGNILDWSRLPYLLKTHEWYYAFSLAVLRQQMGIGQSKGHGILKIAPVFPAGERGLTPLLNSKGEIEAIRNGKSQSLTTSGATWPAFENLAGNYQAIHLSTHAEAGLAPAIEFWDRRVLLPDIYAMNLNAGLIVLSACQTGLGDWQQGEGVMSLSRAFTYAGAGSLISSLWTVNEGSTAQLFSSFYGHLSAGKNRAAALREAKLNYLMDPAVAPFQKTPYYWAGYVYLGPDAPLDLRGTTDWLVVGFVSIGALLCLLFFIWKRKKGVGNRDWGL